MIPLANRLQNVEEYYFSKKLREVRLLESQGKPIINLGIGSPDLSPPERVLNALVETFNEDGAHKYQSYQGIPELREAITDFYKRHFNVPLSPLSEVLPLLGSKEGIMHVSLAFLNPGDEVLIPNPGYPSYESVTKLVGAQPRFYDLKEENQWFPDLLELEKQGVEKVKLMWVNYPHMPTGAQATNKLFEDLITFAKRHQILIVNDNPYSFILNRYPRSILKYRDAKEVCMELNSLSKTFNMAGWRVGMLMGKPEYIQAVLRVKSNMDSGMFLGIQKGAIEALNCSDMWFMSLNSVYEQRREVVWKIAEALNCTYDSTAAGLFVWCKLPDYLNAEDYVDVILKEKSVFIAPGTIFGSNGDRYIRISLCASQDALEEALKRLS
ncbi:pyridoxal phosphate-dependent aminotransferase [Psychroserpens sp. XS_ASV72]|uniref:pyridoxal phosphate-dependent aminotransferase n=1 Tax=Psychroserpens sp. XS_ASV72 TaxID=3241293 RepID=UPI003514130A